MTEICIELTAAHVKKLGTYYERPVETLQECIGKECGKYNQCHGIQITAGPEWTEAVMRAVSGGKHD